MAHTLLAFHAHPDDEALLTAGTMARAAAEGHRVIVVVATDGNEGLASSHFSAGGRLGDSGVAAARPAVEHAGGDSGRYSHGRGYLTGARGYVVQGRGLREATSW